MGTPRGLIVLVLGASLVDEPAPSSSIKAYVHMAPDGEGQDNEDGQGHTYVENAHRV